MGLALELGLKPGGKEGKLFGFIYTLIYSINYKLKRFISNTRIHLRNGYRKLKIERNRACENVYTDTLWYHVPKELVKTAQRSPCCRGKGHASLNWFEFRGDKFAFRGRVKHHPQRSPSRDSSY